MIASVDIGNNSVVSLDDMITHDQALEKYVWLTPQILHRWRREKAIRSFKGRDGKQVYPMQDLAQAMTRELGCGNNPEDEGSSSTGSNGSGRKLADQGSIDIGTMTEAAALREKHSLQVIWGAPRKSLSQSLPAKKSPRSPRTKSSSLTS